ncbi:hypothetical protein ES703_08969 [subsurface metagenome]
MTPVKDLVVFLPLIMLMSTLASRLMTEPTSAMTSRPSSGRTSSRVFFSTLTSLLSRSYLAVPSSSALTRPFFW